MKREECRDGMVVYDRIGHARAVVIKCNPKNARVRLIEPGRSPAGALWNIPYALLDPVFSENLNTEMMMRSFEDPDNPAFKSYFSAQKDNTLPDLVEGTPDYHIVMAICALWERLKDENLERECQEEIEKEALKPNSKRRPSTIMRDIQAQYSSKINSLFSAIGREVTREVAEKWIADRKEKVGTV